MNKFKKDNIISKLSNQKFILIVWVLMTLIPCLLKFLRDDAYNNFLIFRDSFLHTLEQLPLYESYPPLDLFLYGISFTTIMAPFALIPPYYGMVIWCLANSLFLYYAIKKLNLPDKKFAAVIWLCANELYTCVLMQQYNIAIAGMIVLAYTLIERKKEFWAAFFIILGTLTKVYAIVGVAFLLFSKRKMVFIGSLIFWSIVIFIIPMIYTSPEYILGQYHSWIETLLYKNNLNLFTSYTNISLLGMVRKISGNGFYSDMWLIIPGILLCAAPSLRIKQYKNQLFRLQYLVSVMLFFVLFSTGTENSGFIAAMVGVSIWYLNTPSRYKHHKINLALLIFCIILTSFSPTDIFPASIRKTYVIPYALKALPCAVIWFKIVWEQLTMDFSEPSKLN